MHFTSIKPFQGLKLKHYNSVGRRSVLYVSERLSMNRKSPLKKLEYKERKILKRILGLIREDDSTYRTRHNKELYDDQQNMITSMRKGDKPSTHTSPA